MLIINDNLFDADQTAKKLNISRPTLWRWVKNGKISPICIGKVKVFSINDIRLHINKNK